jgi:general secretion pathway protein M
MTAPQRLQWWTRLGARERRFVTLAAAAIALALLWLIAIAPALGVLRQASAQRAALGAQAERMQRLKQEAQALKALPRLSHDEARRALEASLKQRLGEHAQFTVTGDRATVQLKDAPAAALAGWLTDARINARAIPIEAKLQRSSSSASDAAVVWSGTLQLGLP